jgi:hypothetical protein
MRIPILLTFAALALAGRNDNQGINLSGGQTSARTTAPAVPTIPRPRSDVKLLPLELHQIVGMDEEFQR